MNHSGDQCELNLGEVPNRKATSGLIISRSPGKGLSAAQVEFNKQMQSLERARKAHDKEVTRLEKELRICREELMPLVERCHRADFDLVLEALAARGSIKFTKRRHQWLGDLISGKAADLLNDPSGLTDGEISRLEAIVEELGKSIADQEQEESDRAEFDVMKSLLEQMGRDMGVEIDLDGLDITGNPDDFERELEKRFANAGGAFQEAVETGTLNDGTKRRKRKPTKAAMEREKKQQAIEEAKSRDLKTLYKQLAKVLHPDLETDLERKEHRSEWMKRLTTARKEGDLREMLAIELEWLGEEAHNLATASDEKLKIYSLVLKEQAKEQREKTRHLEEDPQYQLLFRFRGPYGEPQPLIVTKRVLIDEAERLEEMIDVLRSHLEDRKQILNDWADSHARQWG